MEELAQIMGGVKPSQEIPALWFEVFKLQELAIINTPVLEVKAQEIVNRAFKKLQKKFPNMEFDLELTKLNTEEEDGKSGGDSSRTPKKTV